MGPAVRNPRSIALSVWAFTGAALTVGLSIFRAQTPQTGPDWAGLMAATLVAALPMLILFAVFAKRIVNSIGFSGIK